MPPARPGHGLNGREGRRRPATEDDVTAGDDGASGVMDRRGQVGYMGEHPGGGVEVVDPRSEAWSACKPPSSTTLVPLPGRATIRLKGAASFQGISPASMPLARPGVPSAGPRHSSPVESDQPGAWRACRYLLHWRPRPTTN